MQTAFRHALIVLYFVFAVCCAGPHGAVNPSITFTKVPPFTDQGGETLDAIEGEVHGARPGQTIVLYARSGEWWVQPMANQPLTTILADSSWKNRTHPGTAYAAILVEAGYHPSPKTDVLPEKGGSVLAVATTRGRGKAGKFIVFGGYQWKLREGIASISGTLTEFNPANAWTDASGFLHLRIAGSREHWTCPALNLPRSLGYGTYRFVVRGLGQAEPSAVFTMMVSDETGPAREMDIEISKWGEASARNGQFVIQPYHIPANTVQFQVPEETASTFMLRWAPGRAEFRVFAGQTSTWNSKPVRQHVFTSGVPVAGEENVRMIFYVFGRTSIPLQHENEIVVEAFEYLP